MSFLNINQNVNVLDLVQTGFVQRVQSKEGKVISLFFVVSFYENKLVRDKNMLWKGQCSVDCGASPFFFVQSSHKEKKLSRENALKKSESVWLWDCAYSVYSGTILYKSGEDIICPVFTWCEPASQQNLNVAEFEFILQAGDFCVWILVIK